MIKSTSNHSMFLKAKTLNDLKAKKLSELNIP
jgi:hypothetical protein